jgi:hypothetical protein
MANIGYKQTKIGDFLITVPNNFKKTMPFAVVFGGLYNTTGEWMKKRVPEELLRMKPFVFAPWETTLESINNTIPGIKINSVSGYSKGGVRAYPALSTGFNFVGLIDPSIEGDYSKVVIPPNANFVLAYQSGRTWGASGLNYAAEKLKKINPNNVLAVNVGHSEFPEYFFKTFGSRL